ncbi:hypothetical protein L9F63_024688 [Diploptera punctata]|uniref:E3 ubiquitin-protein ligase RNF10 n=1 Tax=Diploptera punctata TaxID=6984 RepID=A0AAD8E774_DIPPU|nr:hypothetical protein L9F63_024688 [Diploptera punctata]
MLEDYTMEKKPSGRSAQVPGKANGTELKKSQGGIEYKPFPRSSRRREPNVSNGTKIEPNRKPTPQKNKCFDKRPRPRGQYYGCGKENTKVAEEDAEYGSVLIPGSKKQNLNHLLNFHYAPRESTTRSFQPGAGRYGSARWLTSTHKHKYNKEQFLQANCQFVVQADGNYSAYTSNPDALVNWDLIEQIRLQSSEMLSCPICLYPPTAAKMTRCGHVYCWPCILHYLALSDKAWRKCPICYEAVHKQDLKSVIAVPHMQFSVGKEITMRLMKRERGSLVALPMEQCGIRPADKLLSVSETLVDTVHSKLLLATPQEVIFIVNKEKEQLQKQLSDEVDCPETCFIEQAIGLLDERLGSLNTKIVPEPPQVEHSADNLTTPTYSSPKLIYRSAFDDEYVTIPDVACSPDGLADDVLHAVLGSSDEASTDGKERERYETADGQHIYLHALNVRMLEYYYGSLENCPSTLIGQIVEMESGSMTDDLRRRLRYLQHLPVTCQFEVAELQLKPPVVSKETMEHFKDQLEVRRRRRQRRAREEKLREKKINEEENRRWGRYPAAEIRIESHQHFPQCGSEVVEPIINHQSVESSLAGSPSRSSPLPARDENLVLDVPEVQPVGSPDSSGISFAQMLREGKSKSSDWPRVTKKNPPVKPSEVRHHSDSEPEPEGYVPAPTFSQSFSDAIALALEKCCVKKNIEVCGENGSNSGKKKKKQKQKVLFATGMACSGK